MKQLPKRPVLDAVRHRDERFRLLIESMLDYAIYTLDADGMIDSWNAGAERLKGYRADEILGRHFSTFYTPEDIASGKPMRELEIAARDGRVEDEGWRVRKDGSRFWANAVITALRSPTGELLGFGKVTRDLTERRNTEEALRRSEERLRLMVESVRDYAIFMLDPTGNVASWNAGAARTKGYAPDEIIGSHFSTFYSQSDIDAGKPAMELREAARMGRFEDEGWRVRKDGSRFWANVVITAMRDPAGELLGFVKITRDLTDRRRAEEERVRRARAEESVRMRDEFLSIASHELRTPLTSLRIQADSLARGLARDESTMPRQRLAARVANVRTELDRLEGLVHDLLDVTRISGGRLELRREKTDLAVLADRVTRQLAESIDQTGSTVSFAAQGDTVGNWDPARLDQVVVNLLTNATKYGSGKPIDVRVRGDGAEVELTVEDRGIGIEPTMQDEIFDRFARASDVRHHGGLGLGLWITRQIVEAHGGTVTVTSAVRKGSRFRVRLPREAA